MTIAIALRDGADVWVGLDSRTTGESGSYANTDKLVPLNIGRPDKAPVPALVVCAGVHRVADEVRYRWEPPPYEDQEPDRYAAEFAASLESHLRADHLEKLVADEDGLLDVELILAFAGTAFMVASDFSLFGLSKDGYRAIGTGASYAIGVLHASKDRSPRTRLRMALQCAAEHQSDCGPPFHVVKLDRPEVGPVAAEADPASSPD